MGRVEGIWLKRARGGPMDARERVVAVAAVGLQDNAGQGGKRQVTLLSAESWEEVVAVLGHHVDPRLRRANLLLRGVDLRDSRGRELQVGGCRLLIRGETRPCRAMEEACAGLQAVLAERWRGGAYGEVIAGGEIRVGDPARWLDDGPLAATVEGAGRDCRQPL